MEHEWHTVQRDQQVSGQSDLVTVRLTELTAASVTATVAVAEAAAEPVWFSDGLYGATAWAWNGDRWARADTAEIRLTIAPSIDPGGQADLTLPLAGVGRSAVVRVLVRTPVDGAGAWASEAFTD